MALEVMRGIAIERGGEVDVGGQHYVITHVLDLDFVMAQQTATGQGWCVSRLRTFGSHGH